MTESNEPRAETLAFFVHNSLLSQQLVLEKLISLSFLGAGRRARPLASGRFARPYSTSASVATDKHALSPRLRPSKRPRAAAELPVKRNCAGVRTAWLHPFIHTFACSRWFTAYLSV